MPRLVREDDFGFLAIAMIIALFFLRNVLRDLFSDAASSVSNAPGG